MNSTGNSMADNLNEHLDRHFPADTGQRRIDIIEANVEELWFNKRYCIEGQPQLHEFNEIHQALLAGDDGEIGRLYRKCIKKYLTEIAEQRA